MDAELLTQVVPRHQANWRSGEELRRRVEVGGVRGVWKRFVVLPNLDGQKYTIGETFTNREEQGEFIFLNYHQLEKIEKRGDPLCEIVCRRNKYWVTSGQNSIFINGENIGRRRMQLKFGDILSFEEKLLAVGLFEEGHEIVRFLFKERELIPEVFLYSEARLRLNRRQKEQKVEKDAAFRALSQLQNKGGATLPPAEVYGRIAQPEIMVVGNPLLVSSILSHLPLEDLKNFRLVSKLWRDEAFRLLKKRAVVKFKFETAYDCGAQPSKFFQYIHDMKHSPLPNMEIRHLAIGECSFDSAERNDFTKKWISDLDWFLAKPIHSSLRRLHLTGIIQSQLEFDLRIQILVKLQDTLQDLELSGCWMNGIGRNNAPAAEIIPTTYQFPPGLIKFNRLRRFCFSMYIAVWNVPDSMLDWVQALIEGISGVTSLSLPMDARLTLIFLQKLNDFPNLEEINIELMDPAGMEVLLSSRLQQPLKKLGLNILKYFRPNNIPMFEELLAKYSNTLVELELTVPTPWPQTDVHLPAFPCLKELKVERNLYYNRRLNDVGDYEFYSVKTNLTFGSGKGVIDYGLHFPSLQSLSVNADTYSCQYLEGHGAFYNSFFPLAQESGQICKTLQRLYIPNAGDYLRWRCASLPTARDEISKMFPGVHNRWMNEAREPLPEPIPQMVLRSAARKVKKSDYNGRGCGRGFK